MKLFQQEEKGEFSTNRPKSKKKDRILKHKRERRAANQDPEIPANYNKFKGYEL